MKQLYSYLSIAFFAIVMATTQAKAQAFPLADPSADDINKQGPSDGAPTGSNISGNAIMKFDVANSSVGTPANGRMPAQSVFYTIQFNPYFTYQSLVPSTQFEILAAFPSGNGHTVFLRNTVAIDPGDVFSFYLNVVATQETTQPNQAIVTMNVTRTLPIQCANTSTSNDNVSKAFNVVSLISLPVRSINLSAVLNDQNVDLKWITKDEVNVSKFELERSTDGRNFSVVTNKQAAGNTTGETTYTHRDDVHTLTASVIYYRIKATDQDGQYYYSRVVTATVGKGAAIMVYPNPFVGQVNIRINASAKGKAVVRFYTSTGVIVKQMEASVSTGTNFLTLDDLERLPKQTYLIEVMMNNERVFSGKLIK